MKQTLIQVRLFFIQQTEAQIVCPCSNFHKSRLKNNHDQLQLHLLPEIYIERIYMYFRVSFLDMNIDILR